jgi:hypothetical protein
LRKSVVKNLSYRKNWQWAISLSYQQLGNAP